MPGPVDVRPADVCWVEVDVVSATLTVRGEVDYFTASALTGAGHRLLNAPGVQVTVSLAGVTFADCALVNAVATLNRDARSTGRRLRLVDVPAAVVRVMTLAGAADLLCDCTGD